MDRVLLGDTIDLILTLQHKNGDAYAVSDSAVVRVALVDTLSGSAVSAVATMDKDADSANWPLGVVAGSVVIPTSVDSLPVRLAIEVEVANESVRRSWLSRTLYELVQDGIV